MPLLFLDATGNYSDPAETDYRYLRADGVWAEPDEGYKFYDATGNWSTPELLTIPPDSEGWNLLTWEQIAKLSAKAAEDPTPFLFLTDADHKVEKDVDLSGIGWSPTTKARIIGIGQDVGEHDEVLGITWQFCDGTNHKKPSVMQINPDRNINGGWEQCEMRTTKLPSIETQLPLDLKTYLKATKKKTGMTSGSSNVLVDTIDKLALLSFTEVFGDDQDFEDFGTSGLTRNKGENQWYQWYKTHNFNENRIIVTNEGEKRPWWLRSRYNSTFTNNQYGCVSEDGKMAGNYPEAYDLPCACFVAQI